MSPVVLFGVAAVTASVPLVMWAFFARPDRARRQAQDNLNRGMGVADAPESYAVQPAAPVLTSLARRLTPAGSLTRLDRLLAKAGRPAAWPLERLLVAKLVLPLVLAALTWVYARSAHGSLPVLVGVACTLVSYFLPELLLHSKGQERSQKIALALADTLDQMTIAVEAGLGFDSAMARAGRNGKGPLAEELIRALQDIQVGQSRREAYESLGQRTAVPDLRRFTRAIIQADRYGIAIADVLRTQAAEMRMKRRQRAEEKAMQIPVKVIFPLMLCVLPVLFIVLLGPAAMDMMKAFS